MSTQTLVNGLLSDLKLLGPDGSSNVDDKKDIIRYLNEGRCLIATLNPRFYAETKTFTLEPGNFHEICECEQIAEILGQAHTDDEKACSHVNSTKFPQNWGCDDLDLGFRLTKISISSDKKHIETVPPVPEGETVNVTISCVPKLDDIDNDTDINCKDAAVLAQWVLYRATLAEADTPESISLARLYLNTFAELTNLKVRIIERELERNS